MEIVLGTRNRKKKAELELLLRPFGFAVRSLAEFAGAIEVVEDGASFAENAAKKATQQAVHLRQWVLGEDSGIEVEALGGAPGILSARFAGPDATDEQNNQLLLARLKGIPRLAERAANYVCHMCLADPHGQIRIACEATCQGLLRTRPPARAGLDMIHCLRFQNTIAHSVELSASVKSVLSHRAAGDPPVLETAVTAGGREDRAAGRRRATEWETARRASEWDNSTTRKRVGQTSTTRKRVGAQSSTTRKRVE